MTQLQQRIQHLSQQTSTPLGRRHIKQTSGHGTSCGTQHQRLTPHILVPLCPPFLPTNVIIGAIVHCPRTAVIKRTPPLKHLLSLFAITQCWHGDGGWRDGQMARYITQLLTLLSDPAAMVNACTWLFPVVCIVTRTSAKDHAITVLMTLSLPPPLACHPCPSSYPLRTSATTVVPMKITFMNMKEKH